MRIIHTSDWHLGQHFMGKTRESEHRAFLSWLLASVREQGADALVVTGDIFDTGTPPSYARAMYNEFIVSLQQTACSCVVILGGNHDSAATLNEGKSLLACLKTRVVAGLSQDPQDHLILVREPDGTPGLLICALPFLRPSDLVLSMGGQTGREKQENLSQAIEAVYARVFEQALSRQKVLAEESGGRAVPVMATGHLTLVGTSSTESVRDIYIGSLSGFPSAKLPPADYTALGHLHRAQEVGKCPHIRYSGSPIPLSFDEAGQVKQVIRIDFQPGAPPEIEPLPIPRFRTLASLKGDLETIARDLKNLAETAEEGDPDAGIWLEAEVAGDDFLSDLTERVQAMVLEAGFDPADLLRVRRQRKGPGRGLVPRAAERLEDLSPNEVFRRRLDLEELDPEQSSRLTELFEQILAQVTDPSEPSDSAVQMDGHQRKVEKDAQKGDRP